MTWKPTHEITWSLGRRIAPRVIQVMADPEAEADAVPLYQKDETIASWVLLDGVELLYKDDVPAGSCSFKVLS